MSDKNACSHSTLGYLRDAVGITIFYLKRQRSSSSVSSISFFSLIERVLTCPTLVAQTGEFSAVTWANDNLL